MTNERSLSGQIIDRCIKVDEYLKTIQKALAHDGDSTNDFENHYWELIEEACKTNWENHDIASQISRDDFRKNLRLD